MICLGQCDDEFTSALVACVDTNTRINESFRIHQRYQLKQEIGLRLEEIWCLASNGSLKFLGVLSRNAIPALGFTPVFY